MTISTPADTRLTPMGAADAVAQCANINIDPDHAAAVLRHASRNGDIVLWWLSFSTHWLDDLNTTPRYLGTVVTPARVLTDAIAATHRLNINPGGVITVSGPFPVDAIDVASQNVLLPREDMERISTDRISEAVDRYIPPNQRATRVCACGFTPMFWPCSKCGRARS